MGPTIQTYDHLPVSQTVREPCRLYTSLSATTFSIKCISRKSMDLLMGNVKGNPGFWSFLMSLTPKLYALRTISENSGRKTFKKSRFATSICFNANSSDVSCVSPVSGKINSLPKWSEMARGWHRPMAAQAVATGMVSAGENPAMTFSMAWACWSP